MPVSRADFEAFHELYFGNSIRDDKLYEAWQMLPSPANETYDQELNRMEDFFIIAGGAEEMSKQDWKELREEYFAVHPGDANRDFPWEEWREWIETP